MLEIGTGSGYQAARLAEMAAEVYTIEIVKELAERASADLTRLGYTNVHVRAGDGYKGWAEAAPFDSIIVTCAPEGVPEPLVAAAQGGRAHDHPVGSGWGQDLVLLRKRGGKVERSAVLPVRFCAYDGRGATETEIEVRRPKGRGPKEVRSPKSEGEFDVELSEVVFYSLNV